MQRIRTFPGSGWKGNGHCARPEGPLDQACNARTRKKVMFCKACLEENKRISEEIREKLCETKS